MNGVGWLVYGDAAGGWIEVPLGTDIGHIVLNEGPKPHEEAEFTCTFRHNWSSGEYTRTKRLYQCSHLASAFATRRFRHAGLFDHLAVIDAVVVVVVVVVVVSIRR